MAERSILHEKHELDFLVVSGRGTELCIYSYKRVELILILVKHQKSVLDEEVVAEVEDISSAECYITSNIKLVYAAVIQYLYLLPTGGKSPEYRNFLCRPVKLHTCSGSKVKIDYKFCIFAEINVLIIFLAQVDNTVVYCDITLNHDCIGYT